MAKRVNLYVTDDLYREARAELGDDFNWSEGLRDHLSAMIRERRASTGCTHPVVTCRECGSVVDREGVST